MNGGANGHGAVHSVDRALRLVELLAAAPSGMGVVELARATDVPQGTVHRLLRTMGERGWVRQDSTRRYVPGPAVILLRETGKRLLAAAAQPYLAELVEISGESANLAVLEGDRVVYVAQAPSAHRLRLFAEVGNRVPAHSTGVGKVLLACLPDDEAMALLDRCGLPARTPTTITALDAMRDELATIHLRGHAVDDGEEEVGVRCVALPVHDQRGRVVAAVSVSGPLARMNQMRPDALAARMRPVAERLSAEVLRSAGDLLQG